MNNAQRLHHSGFEIKAVQPPVLAGIQQQHLLDASAQVVEIGARLVHGVGVLVLLLLSQVPALSSQALAARWSSGLPWMTCSTAHS